MQIDEAAQAASEELVGQVEGEVGGQVGWCQAACGRRTGELDGRTEERRGARAASGAMGEAGVEVDELAEAGAQNADPGVAVLEGRVQGRTGLGDRGEAEGAQGSFSGGALGDRDEEVEVVHGAGVGHRRVDRAPEVGALQEDRGRAQGPVEGGDDLGLGGGLLEVQGHGAVVGGAEVRRRALLLAEGLEAAPDQGAEAVAAGLGGEGGAVGGEVDGRARALDGDPAEGEEHLRARGWPWRGRPGGGVRRRPHRRGPRSGAPGAR